MCNNGPIQQYLNVTGMAEREVETLLKKGDPAAAAVFGADKLFGVIESAVTCLENIEMSSDD